MKSTYPDRIVRKREARHYNAQTLKLAVKTYAHRTVRVVTDSFSLYEGIGEGFRGGHYTVNHSIKEYARTALDGFVTHSNKWAGEMTHPLPARLRAPRFYGFGITITSRAAAAAR